MQVTIPLKGQGVKMRSHKWITTKINKKNIITITNWVFEMRCMTYLGRVTRDNDNNSLIITWKYNTVRLQHNGLSQNYSQMSFGVSFVSSKFKDLYSTSHCLCFVQINVMPFMQYHTILDSVKMGSIWYKVEINIRLSDSWEQKSHTQVIGRSIRLNWIIIGLNTMLNIITALKYTLFQQFFIICPRILQTLSVQ